MERFRYDRSSKWLIEHQGKQILYLGDIRDIEECRLFLQHVGGKEEADWLRMATLRIAR